MNGIVTLGFPEVSVVAHTIQLALAPVFLLAGIGAFLNVSVSRMARVVDRARVVEKLLPASTGAEHDRLVEEVRILDRRIKVVNRAILLTVTAAVLTCLVVILLFASNLISANLGTLIALLFIASMISMCLGFAMFIVETRLSARAVHIRNEILYHQERTVDPGRHGQAD